MNKHTDDMTMAELRNEVRRLKIVERRIPTQDEILERYKKEQERDLIFNHAAEDFFVALEFDKAKEFFKDPITSENEAEERQDWDKNWEHSQEYWLKKMRKYMEFAWEKANNCRGLSSIRSLQHFVAWTWLAGDREFSEKLEFMTENKYEFYGKNILAKICEFYSWNSKKWDDGIRQNEEY